jgi:hypothetical protein
MDHCRAAVGLVNPRAARVALALCAAALLGACVTGPRVVALPGSGRTLQEFDADDAGCRTWAAGHAGAGSQWRYDTAYLQCMYARGHRVPVAGDASGYASPRPAAIHPQDVPPPPPGTPPPPPPGPAR